jgi:hypothetical protein
MQNLRVTLIAVIFWIEDVAKVPANNCRYPDRTGCRYKNAYIKPGKETPLFNKSESSRLNSKDDVALIHVPALTNRFDDIHDAPLKRLTLGSHAGLEPQSGEKSVAVQPLVMFHHHRRRTSAITGYYDAQSGYQPDF